MTISTESTVRRPRIRAKLAEVSRAMQLLAAGDDTATIPDDDGGDGEISALIGAARKFRSALVCSREFANAAERERQCLNAAVSNMPVGLSMFDESERIITCNDAYCKIYGLAWDAALPGTGLRDIYKASSVFGSFADDALRDYRKAVAESIAENRNVLSLLDLPNGGTISYSVRPLETGGWIAVHEDITERRRAEARITHMARHDALTDLPNRVYFREQMEKALQNLPPGDTLSVFSLDLDHFKDINDTLGHPVGDRLLMAVAARLQGCICGSDFIARLGGDEFAVLQIGAKHPEGTIALARRIIDAVAEPYEFDGQRIVIGVSVGVAVAPIDGMVPDELLKNSDMALYYAKTVARGAFRFFDVEMDARLQARRLLEMELRRGVEEEEFEVYYQPVIDPERDKVVSFEALLRWRHPERGIVPPDEFIPLAEESGLIVPIGGWILRRACRDAMTWPNDISIAVNVSAIQFRSSDLVEEVIRALAVSKLPPYRLELEITESVLLVNTDAILSTLERLHGFGVSIAMDDFGTGYSSLSYLRRFPFDRIKIDRSFVRDLSEDAGSLAVVSAIAGLGRSLGMKTTVEGVESPEQYRLLRAEGVTAMQGFLFAPPRPLVEASALLDAPAPEKASRVA